MRIGPLKGGGCESVISSRFNAQPLLGIERCHLRLEQELAGAGTNRDSERRRRPASPDRRRREAKSREVGEQALHLAGAARSPAAQCVTGAGDVGRPGSGRRKAGWERSA